MKTTDTQFDRLAELTQEAVDMLKAAIERAEAAEAERDSNKELYDSWYRKHLRKLQAVKAERDALQSQVDDLSDNRNPRRNEKVRNQRRELDALGNAYRIVYAERAALQARIDAGVRVWGKDLGNGEWCWSYTEYHTIDTHTAILIDPKPIADHVADAGKMIPDQRTGPEDRRERKLWDSPNVDSPCRRSSLKSRNSTVESARSNCRRRTPGTKADRKQAYIPFKVGDWVVLQKTECGKYNECYVGKRLRIEAVGDELVYFSCGPWPLSALTHAPDRRTGERRVEGSWEYCSCRRFLEPSCYKNTDYCWRPTSGDGVFAQDNRRDPSGANDRRKGKA